MTRSPQAVAVAIAAELRGAILCGNAGRRRRCVAAARRADMLGRARGAVSRCIATAEAMATGPGWPGVVALDALADLGE